ncbi:MAG TPA: multiheme c-type cytochrome [Candidatus Acidoferrum sp.]
MSLDRPRALLSFAAFLFAAALFFCAHLAAHASPGAHSSSAHSSNAPATKISLATEDRIDSPGFWPTKSAASLDKFVGTAECAKCHTQIATTQKTTPMAQAATPAANSEILKSHSDLNEQRAAYHYEISTTQQAVNFSVTDGAQSLSSTIEWAFGLGHKGQTYIYERDGGFYESHLSFYKSLQALDLTTGHDAANPDDLKSAMGRWLDADEARRCFGCHTTASNVGGHFNTSHLTPGVQCESCHGPGANHVAAMKSGKIEQGRAAIFNPRRLDATASVDFCGACHRTWADVILGEQKLRPGTENVMNVRFQPYRLEDSKCWRASNADPRLACTTCHNPHEPLNQQASSYDAKCLTCHTQPPTGSNHATTIGAAANSAATKSVTANFVVTQSVAANSIAPNSLAEKSAVKSFTENFVAIDSATEKSATVNSHVAISTKICPVSKTNCITCHMPQVEVPTVHATFFDHRIRIVQPNSPYPM